MHENYRKKKKIMSNPKIDKQHNAKEMREDNKRKKKKKNTNIFEVGNDEQKEGRGEIKKIKKNEREIEMKKN